MGSGELTRPQEGIPFEVNPLSINLALFRTARDDEMQEVTRQLILEAFTEVNKDPEKYAIPFKTLMPRKTWNPKPVIKLVDLAHKYGEHMADWVEQALEWAQRISNGETWEELCNEPDTANWYRVIVWKNGNLRLVGGAHRSKESNPATDIFCKDCYENSVVCHTVPLVVLYD